MRAACVLTVVDVFVCGVCVGCTFSRGASWAVGVIKSLLGSVRESKEKVLVQCVCAQHVC